MMRHYMPVSRGNVLPALAQFDFVDLCVLRYRKASPSCACWQKASVCPGWLRR